MTPGVDPEEVLVQALYQHGVRNPTPPLDPIGLDARLARADRIGLLRKAGALGAVVVIFVGLLFFGLSKHNSDVTTTNATGMGPTGAATTTIPTANAPIVLDPNQANDPGITEEGDAGSTVDTSDSTTSTVSTVASTIPASSSSTTTGHGNPTETISVPVITDAPFPPTHPTAPTTSTTSTPTTTGPPTTAPPPGCSAYLTPGRGTGGRQIVRIDGQTTVPSGRIDVTSARSRPTTATFTADSYGTFLGRVIFDGILSHETFTVTATCYPSGTGQPGMATMSYTRTD